MTATLRTGAMDGRMEGEGEGGEECRGRLPYVFGEGEGAGRLDSAHIRAWWGEVGWALSDVMRVPRRAVPRRAAELWTRQVEQWSTRCLPRLFLYIVRP